MSQPKKKGGASSYATGGGGVSLERSFGATLLSSLLLGDPVPGLGDEQTVTAIQFQAGDSSPVDDFVISGEPRGSSEDPRRISIAVRRNPTIGPSDKKFVKLLSDFIRTLLDKRVEVESDRWRLGLVVAGPHSGVREIGQLADLARGHANSITFREVVGRKGAMRASVRKRLRLLDESVAAAISQLSLVVSPEDSQDFTWLLLRALRVIEMYLEGDDARDRTNAIARLRAVAGEAIAAESLLRILGDLAGQFATKGAVVDEATLRRALSGNASVGRSSTFGAAWTKIESCEERLRARTRNALSDTSTLGHPRLSLSRTEQTNTLTSFLRDVAKTYTAALITGAPDVGKSALALAAIDRLRSESIPVVALGLRDLPATPADVEQYLGASLSRVLAGGAVESSRIVVLDGAEIAIEGKADLLTYIARAALQTGFAVVAVTRDDARSAVLEALNEAAAASGGRTSPKVIEVPDLSETEVEEIVQAFPALAQVASEPRSRRLLRRPGLVEVLLRNGAYAALPSGALSEADVFAAVWKRVVRKNEQHAVGEPGPDARENALLAIARRELGAESSPLPETSALPSLRSDGLLMSLGATYAWSAGDQFADDLIRDFSIARLLLTSTKESLLAKTGAPRWALRATRLALQAELIQARADIENTRAKIQAYFDVLAKEYGERWADVPWEAALTLGASSHVLRQAAPALMTKQGAGLGQVLRIVQQRLTINGLPNIALVKPIVEFIWEQKGVLGSLPRDVAEKVDEVVASWLAALAARGHDDVPDAVRVRLRDDMLGHDPGYSDEHRLRCLGLLGPDLDARVDAEFRALASRAPHRLHACLEQSLAPYALAKHHPNLLLTLAEAYYIEQPDRQDRHWMSRSRLEDGIREHRVTGGWQAPLAAWHYGPFWDLLCVRPHQAIAFVNRMLNHAARYRVARDAQNPNEISLTDLPGITVDIPGVGTRRFVGDQHVWRWYRGAGVGPYPCMSALLAVERFADQVLAQGITLMRLIALLLTDCENLAMPGLLVGLLVRHIDRVIDELDPWLAHPGVWNLEFTRSTEELLISCHVQGADAEDTSGRTRRMWSPRHVAAFLVFHALRRGDQCTLQRLSAVAHRLIDRAAVLAAWDKDDDIEPDRAVDVSLASNDLSHKIRRWMLTVRGWASTLEHANYDIEPSEDGDGVIRHEAPKEIREALAAEQRDRERGQDAWRLVSLYAMDNSSSWGPSLSSDLALARALQSDPPSAGSPNPAQGPAAVAAAALICHVDGRAVVLKDDLRWAIDTLLPFAKRDEEDYLLSATSKYPMGTDRLAARGLAAALLLDGDTVDTARHGAALDGVRSLMTSFSDEVRRIVATSLSSVWTASCRPVDAAGNLCLHRVTFDAARGIARYCLLGSLDPKTGKSSIEAVPEPVESELARAETRDLCLDRLTPPLLMSIAAAASMCCIASDAERLRDTLLLAYRRARVLYAEEGFYIDDDDDHLMASALLDCRSPQRLLEHVDALCSYSFALTGFLRGLSVVATLDPEQRRVFRAQWPMVMDVVLNAIAGGRDFRGEGWNGMRALSYVVPHPTTRGYERDVEAILRSAVDGWPTLDELLEQIERWVPLAIGSPNCVDALIQLLNTAPQEDQCSRGLPWIAALVTPQPDRIAGHTALLAWWLEQLRGPVHLNADWMRAFQQIVDCLVAVGDSHALRLQMATEK